MIQTWEVLWAIMLVSGALSAAFIGFGTYRVGMLFLGLWGFSFAGIMGEMFYTLVSLKVKLPLLVIAGMFVIFGFFCLLDTLRGLPTKKPL